MARKDKHERQEESSSAHDDRPWVFFMIDCFLLMTQFFILTFKFKVDEPVLPKRMPPGSTVPTRKVTPSNKPILDVHVMRYGGAPSYLFMRATTDLQGLREAMQRTTGGGREFTVRVSYEENVPWGDVMAVFNECARFQILEVGLVPLRTARAVSQ